MDPGQVWTTWRSENYIRTPSLPKAIINYTPRDSKLQGRSTKMYFSQKPKQAVT
jgi:hypothetical protein